MPPTVPGLEASDSEDEPEQLQYKVIILGDGAVGKTSVAMRFTEDYFSKRRVPCTARDLHTPKNHHPSLVSLRGGGGQPEGREKGLGFRV